MKETLLSFLALGAIISVALAEEVTMAASKPIKLPESQMDNISAGFHTAAQLALHRNFAIAPQIQLWKYIVGECPTNGACPRKSVSFFPFFYSANKQ